MRDGTENLDRDRLVLDHYEKIFRTLSRLTGCREEAADLTQSVFISAVQSWPTFRGDSSISTWLMRIAFRTWSSQRSNRKSYLQLDLETPSKDPPDIQWLIDLFDQLPKGQREAFYLHEVEGYTVAEVAKITSSPTGTIKARLHFARKALQRKIEEAKKLEQELFCEPNPARF